MKILLLTALLLGTLPSVLFGLFLLRTKSSSFDDVPSSAAIIKPPVRIYEPLYEARHFVVLRILGTSIELPQVSSRLQQCIVYALLLSNLFGWVCILMLLIYKGPPAPRP